MITKDIPTLQIHKLTQAQYDTAKAAGNIDENAIYLTPDEEIPNPDWNQNDETAKDYIKNRPFGEFEEEVVDHEETITGFTEYESGMYRGYSETLDYLLGNYYDECVVYIDGERYETTYTYHSSRGHVGNESFMYDDKEDSGEPFYINFLGGPDGASNTIYTTLEGESHTIKIAHMSETVVKIPEKYLPEISSLPPVTSDDKGKVLAVEDDGNWGAGTVTLKITDDGNGNLSVVLGVVKTIMFAINTMGSSIAEYTAEQNMTWAEWCDSKYNTIGAFIKNNQVMLSDDYYVKEYIQSVLPTDIIEVGHTYDHFISVMS